MKLQKLEKAYILCANEKYLDIVSMCAKSIRQFSKVPIIVYMINSDKKVDVENTNTIKWECDVKQADKITHNDNFYIKRDDVNMYKVSIQRVSVTIDALLNYAETIVYIDSDVIATNYIDRVFSMYDINTPYPYVTEGVYDWLQVDGRGGAMSRDDLSTTLEHPSCELFEINQYVRQIYRTANIYIASQMAIPFIEEWEEMCNHPRVINNHALYAPYHEETLMNVLLWKYNYLDGLPYVYVNGGLDKVIEVYDKLKFTGEDLHISTWFRIPSSRENLLLFHGEKRIDKMEQMIKKILLAEQLKDFNWGWMNNSEEGLFHKQAITFEIFENRLYEQFFEVEENDIVLDIGSSVGPFTYSILPKRPKHVFCIEPSDIEFKTLVSNTIGYPVTQIFKGISSANSLTDTEYLFGNDNTKMEGITFKRLCDLYGLDKIDFIKTDCEGGEYDIFTQDNLQFIKNNVRKIAGEWHLGTKELKNKFRNFRDVYLPQFNNYEVLAIDGVDIKWDLFNEHFIDYYTEVIIYINNKI